MIERVIDNDLLTHALLHFYRHAMNELLSTERTYVEELKAIVEVIFHLI